MRPGHPTVSWGSSFTSWATILYVLLYFFLPHRLPELEAPLQVSVDVPAPATVGKWTRVNDTDMLQPDVAWMVDPATHNVLRCGMVVDDDARNSVARGGSLLPHCPLGMPTNASSSASGGWSWGPRLRLGTNATTKVAQGLPDDGTDGGWAYMFSKVGVHHHPSSTTAMAPAPAGEQHAGGDGGSTSDRTLLLDARLWWKQGTLATSALQQMRLVGSDIAGMDTSDQRAGRSRDVRHHHTFRVLGVTPPTWGQAPLANLVGGANNATLKALAEAIFKHEGAGNATVVEWLFTAALALQRNSSGSRRDVAPNGSTARAPATSSDGDRDGRAPQGGGSGLEGGSGGGAPPKAHHQQPPDAINRSPPMESPFCLWYGTVSIRRQALSLLDSTGGAGTTTNDGVVGAVAASSTARGVVAGELFSLCGDHIVWEATEAMYVEMTSSWNLVVAPCAILPFVIVCMGLMQQYQWMRNSRARTLRISRVQLLVVAMYMLFYVCYAEMLWMSMPNNVKMVNLFYSIAFVAVMGTLHMYATVDTEYRVAHNQDSSRSSVFLTYIIGSSLANLIPVLARTAMFRGPVLMVGCGLFWVPQLVQLVSGGGRDPLVPSFLIGATLIPASFVGIVLLAPSSALAVHPEPMSLVWAIGLVVAGGGAVHIGGHVGAARLLPRWMMPWAHVYHLPRHALRTFAGLSEDPECSICGDSFEHPDDAHAATANDEIWLTPCRHLFHQSCLSQWMEQRMDCPLCRKALPEP